MPIRGRDPKECFNKFTGHLRGLVANTITSRPLIAVSPATNLATLTLSFAARDGHVSVPIETSYGRLYLHIAHMVGVEVDEAEPNSTRFRLTTLHYWYRLLQGPSSDEQALLRWEYDKKLRGGSNTCRHHIQQAAKLPIRSIEKEIDLNKIHLPSGWVTIEEIIRFIICELHFKPPCGDEWPKILEDSERKFYEEFTSKRYTPPHDPPPKPGNRSKKKR